MGEDDNVPDFNAVVLLVEEAVTALPGGSLLGGKLLVITAALGDRTEVQFG